jgi:tetratricopeptide (TPR) repeat protein
VEDGQTWLKSVLARLRWREKHRDVIAAYVAEGARDVIVGKNIVKIGTLVVPTVPLLALLAVVVGALAFAAVQFLGPTEMSDIYNVAVADVGQIDGQGRMRRSETGRWISAWVYDEIAAANEEYAAGNRVSLWHDSLSITQKRVKLGLIAGQTPEARAAAARELAEQINADVLVYGHLTPEQSPRTLVLEFYVSSRLRGEVDLTIGRYQLGEPVPIMADFDPNDTLDREVVGRLVTRRATALFWLLLGLREDLLGRPEEALTIFRQAEAQLPEWRDQGEGKETLYFFTGRAALFQEDDKAAEEALLKALQINPQYHRSHIALGSVYLWRAQRALASGQETDQSDIQGALHSLADAAKAYEIGLELAQASQEPLIEAIARLAQASANALRGQVYYVFLDDLNEAEHLLDLAIQQTGLVLDPLAENGQARYLAQAYDYMGAAYTQKAGVQQVQGNVDGSRASYERALDAYGRCTELGQEAGLRDEILSFKIAPLCQQHAQVAHKTLSALEGE